MRAAYDFEKYQREAHQRALDEAAPCAECLLSVTPENWRNHYMIHHPGVTVPAFPVRETIAYMDTDSLGVAVARIRTDGGTQPRAQMNPVTVENYAEDMQSGAAFPPIVVFYDGSDYWLADGFHRLAAAKRAELEHIKADVRQGTRRDAVLFSVGANATHGLRRTNDDKRRAVLTLLRDDEWVKWSDREIARQCAVTHPFVAKIRIELSGNDYQIRTVTRNGATYTQDTSNIGKRSEPAQPTDNDAEEPQTSYVYNGGYAYCKYCYTVHEDWQVTEAYLWQCQRCDHNTHDTAMDVRSSPYDDAVVAFCKRHEVDEVDVLNAWQQVFERNSKAWKEAQRGYVTGLGGDDVAIEDMDATLVLICADEEAYERAMRQRQYIEESQRRKAALTVLNTSENNEWYTPAEYIAAVHELLGGIDLDPASCEFANQTVQAERIYTLEDDGLTQDWHGRVFLNPPYGYVEGTRESNQNLWSAKLINAYCAGQVSEAVLLINAVTDRTWFQPFWDYPICFARQRIAFYGPDGKAGAMTVGSALVYFGGQRERFAEVFSQFGPVVTGVYRR